jgi:hypothetical protein
VTVGDRSSADGAHHGTFAPDALERLTSTREVQIETLPPSGQARLTVIWIVTDGDEVFVRSVRGTRGRWYRDLLARPTGAVRVGSERITVRAASATDPDSIARVSDLFRAKYGKRSPASTQAMLQPHTLEATLRLEPA